MLDLSKRGSSNPVPPRVNTRNVSCGHRFCYKAPATICSRYDSSYVGYWHTITTSYCVNTWGLRSPNFSNSVMDFFFWEITTSCFCFDSLCTARLSTYHNTNKCCNQSKLNVFRSGLLYEDRSEVQLRQVSRCLLHRQGSLSVNWYQLVNGVGYPSLSEAIVGNYRIWRRVC